MNCDSYILNLFNPFKYFFQCHMLARAPVTSSICSISFSRKMAKRKAETPNGESKKAKENVKACLERSPPPRITNVNGKQIKIISANVAGLRGLLKNESKKCNFLSLIKKENPDIIALQEHKLQEVHVDAEGQNMKELLPNYKQYWTCSTEKKGYSGVAVFIRSNGESGLKQKSMKDFFSQSKNGTSSKDEDCLIPINVQYGLGQQNQMDTIASKEGRVITVELDSLYVVNVYVPNSGQNLERLTYRVDKWDRALSKYLKELEKTKPVILIGDLNVAHGIRDIHNFYTKAWFPEKPQEEDEYKGLKSVAAQAGCTKQERDSFTEFLGNGFIDTFRSFHPNVSGCFTYWSMRVNNRPYNRGLRLDYVVASSKMLKHEDGPKVVDSFILDEMPAFSDHCPVGCLLSL